MEKSLSIDKSYPITSRLYDYGQLAKLKLSLLVVFSAALAFLMGSGSEINWGQFILLVIGGFLVTGSANAFNQCIEKDSDKLMSRTQARPLPDGRMSLHEAIIFACVIGISGLWILAYFMNLSAGLLGLFAIASYTLIYTPLKKITPFAVFVGAFPGAIPPLLGWVAATNQFGTTGWILFCIQFIWQFPHFWAIAWVLDDDYKKAGFRLLPSQGGRDKSSAFQAFVYAFSLVPIGLLPFIFDLTGGFSMVLILLCGVLFAVQAWQLYRDCSMKSARQLMFGSFIYLPVVQIALMLDKI
jgi:heme o synthase